MDIGHRIISTVRGEHLEGPTSNLTWTHFRNVDPEEFRQVIAFRSQRNLTSFNFA